MNMASENILRTWSIDTSQIGREPDRSAPIDADEPIDTALAASAPPSGEEAVVVAALKSSVEPELEPGFESKPESGAGRRPKRSNRTKRRAPAKSEASDRASALRTDSPTTPAEEFLRPTDDRDWTKYAAQIGETMDAANAAQAERDQSAVNALSVIARQAERQKQLAEGTNMAFQGLLQRLRPGGPTLLGVL